MLLLIQISEKLPKSDMNILVIGSLANLEECQAKFGTQHQYTHANHQQDAEQHFLTTNLIFDFMIHEDPQQMEVYRDHPTVTAFLNTTFISLLELTAQVHHNVKSTLFGFCGLLTFVKRPLLEISLRHEGSRDRLDEVCKQLATEYTVVDDRVGLVTPRVICMMINEAYYTVQEGTATREDIDLGMKLGTNYPFGPFEWANKIGVQNVYQTLVSLYEDTKDERYKICSLLKKEALSLIH